MQNPLNFFYRRSKQIIASAVLMSLIAGPFTPAFSLFVHAQSDSVPSITQTERSPQTNKFVKDTTTSVADQLDAVRTHLEENNISPEIIERIDAYEEKLANGPDGDGFLTRAIDFITGNSNAQKAKERIEKIANKQPFKVRGAEKPANTRNVSEFERLFGSQKENPNLKDKIKNLINTGTLQGSPVSENLTPFAWLLGRTADAQASQNPNDYLAEGNEIVFSQAIMDKANELGNDPLTMLNFVRNNVEYVPYYGSKKGSDGALIERAGNDMDQAALLIAMLRYSGTPARYQHIDAQMDVNTVTDLLGVQTANAAAQVLGLHDIPYILFVDSENNPLFFVIEHTYVEAYMPYGYSRGANIGDGGDQQWIPMDPTLNAYYYEQLVDVVKEMKLSGFNVEQFFSEYLTGAYGALEPQEAFKQKVLEYISTQVSSNEDFVYAASLVQRILPDGGYNAVPGTLPYNIAAKLGTYDYAPTPIRHTVTFTVSNTDQTTALNHTAFVSELANSELLLTYDAATQADQDTLDTFDTIYDVVPLSLVNVKPKVKVNGVEIAAGSQAIGLGEMQNYTMEFTVPERTIGGSVNAYVIDTVEKDIITGNTDAIALDTGRIVLPELRPASDIQTSSFVANQRLHKAAQNYLYRLEDTQDELARVMGGGFTDAASRATVFNGIEVNYDAQNDPYSFTWKGLRIDSSITVRYFNRFSDDINTNLKEYAAVHGLQASQDESDIFEDDFSVESIATTKGLRLVADGEFPGITLRKITSVNESDIDTLSVSQAVKDIYHAAVQAGNTIYTPTAPLTYGEWQGLTYININFDSGDAAYTIGEGLNGGYSTCGLFGSGSACEWSISDTELLQKRVENLQATILSPLPGEAFDYDEPVVFTVLYSGTIDGVERTWEESNLISPDSLEDGLVISSLRSTEQEFQYTLTPLELSVVENGTAVFSFLLGLTAVPLIDIVTTEINDSGYSLSLFTFPLISYLEYRAQKALLALSLLRQSSKKLLALFDKKEGFINKNGKQIYPKPHEKHAFPGTLQEVQQKMQARASSENINVTNFIDKPGRDREQVLLDAWKDGYEANYSDIKAWLGDPNSSISFERNYDVGEVIGHGYAAGGINYRDDITVIRMVFQKGEDGVEILHNVYPLY